MVVTSLTLLISILSRECAIRMLTLLSQPSGRIFFLLFINDILLRSYPMILLVPSKIVSGLAVPFPIVKQGVPAIVVSS